MWANNNKSFQYTKAGKSAKKHWDKIILELKKEKFLRAMKICRAREEYRATH